ncbi:locomotion-related protein Hikaru genki-like [Paramacrobiotus metropolitanus]|uniref:locomotion-related protein Hikaru genki-like n=1 Tax=Paramacrobiotus metropolitanus TaxID=2943436 RepID=UPI00244598EF|nr:locomotion-related protein Hikaru genki-like [Paramacrobiotus metropolitanus]
MEQVGFPLFFGVVTSMVVIPNLLINCIPTADTPLTNASIPLHCAPLKLYFPGAVTATTVGAPAAKDKLDAAMPVLAPLPRYEHLDALLVSNVSSADGSRRECQFVCLYGQWTGPLCRRMDMLQRADPSYQPVWQSCYFDAGQPAYTNLSIFYNGLNISEPTEQAPRLTVFPHGGRLMFRCEHVGEYIFQGPAVLQCANGQWEPLTFRDAANVAGIGSGAGITQPSCQPLSDSMESNVQEGRLYPPLLTYISYKGIVAPNYDGRLFVYPGSDLHLGCIYEPRRLGPPKWTWSKSISISDALMQWTRNLYRNKMEWRLTIRNIQPEQSGKFTCTTPVKTSHSFIVEVTAVDCPRPWDDEQLLHTGNFHFNSTVTFGCIAGYRLVGPAAVYCKLNGEWAQSLPTCVAVQCAPLNSSDPNLFLDSNGTFYQASVTFTCAPGYRIVGNHSAHCTHTGNWSAPVPVCESVYCPGLAVPTNGQALETPTERYLVGKMVQFACQKGFMASGPVVATCGEDGRWSNPPPRCEPACEAPRAPANGRVTPVKSAYRVKSHVMYECHGGYRLVGARISYCNVNSSGTPKWSFPAPECVLDVVGGRTPARST